MHNISLLDSQVDVLLNSEAEVAVVGEVLLPQLVFLNLEAPFQDLLGLASKFGQHSGANVIDSHSIF